MDDATQKLVDEWERVVSTEGLRRADALIRVVGAGGRLCDALEAVQPVTPDRETLAKALMGIGWSGWLGAPDTFFLERADALLASGVLGQPRDVEPVTDEALWDFANDLTDAWNIEDENPPSLVEQFRDLFVARFGVLGQPQPEDYCVHCAGPCEHPDSSGEAR